MSVTPPTGNATSARGFAIVIAAASLFGMLGVLSRAAYDLGMEPPAFVAWRAGIGPSNRLSARSGPHSPRTPVVPPIITWRLSIGVSCTSVPG